MNDHRLKSSPLSLRTVAIHGIVRVCESALEWLSDCFKKRTDTILDRNGYVDDFVGASGGPKAHQQKQIDDVLGQ